MSILRIPDDNRGNVGRSASFLEFTPQATTNAYVLVDSVVNMLNSSLISVTLENSGDESLDWKVLAGNTPTIDEAVELQAEATVSTTAFGTYYSAAMVWRYVGVYVKSSAPDTPSEATVIAIAKG